MDELLELLAEIKDDVDFENCEDLIDGHYLESLDILQIISMIDDEFGVSIPAHEIVPENFNSAKSLWNMIQKLQDE